MDGAAQRLKDRNSYEHGRASSREQGVAAHRYGPYGLYGVTLSGAEPLTEKTKCRYRNVFD